MQAGLSIFPESLENSWDDRDYLPVFISVACVAHVFLVFALQWDRQKVSRLETPSFSITLTRPAIPKSTTRARKPRQQASIGGKRTRDQPAPDPDIPADNGKLVLDPGQIMDQIRSMAITAEPPEANYRKFDTSDFPRRETKRESSVTGVKVTGVKKDVRQVVNRQGMTTARLRGRGGSEFCYQRRGDPFDESTWVWARVPLKLCGHL